MSLNTNISGQAKHIKDKKTICLTEDLARHVYKKVKARNVIRVDTIKQEIYQDIDGMDDTGGDINPYCKIIVNKAERDNNISSQMEQWSILSNVIRYI